MNDGGPAFPTYGLTCDKTGHLTNVQTYAPGMSLRDYFAAAALTGLLPSELPELGAKPCDMARRAYELADWMLFENQKETIQPIPHRDWFGPGDVTQRQKEAGK